MHNIVAAYGVIYVTCLFVCTRWPKNSDLLTNNAKNVYVYVSV